jgi:hypothetical protein
MLARKGGEVLAIFYGARSLGGRGGKSERYSKENWPPFVWEGQSNKGWEKGKGVRGGRE